ncbi:MAG: phage holin family protein [Paracoccaceae bacterium]
MLTDHLARLLAAFLRSAGAELGLLAAELSLARRAAVQAAVLAGLGALMLLIFVPVLAVGLVLGLVALGLAPWLATLMTAAALLAAALTLLLAARRCLRRATGAPSRLIGRLRGLIETSDDRSMTDA